MKNRILFISLAVVLALSVGLIGCGGGGGDEIPPEPSVIKVGMSRDVNGFFEMAAFGPTYRTYFAEINDAGGLHLSAYDEGDEECLVPIEVVRIDDGDDSSVSAANIELLINTHHVDFLWGGCGTTHIFTQAPIANYWEYVLMTAEGGATELQTYSLPGMPYVFVNLSFSDWFQLPVLAKMLGEKHVSLYGENATAYITFISEQHGAEYTTVANEYFPANNITILKTVGHPYYTSDFVDVITEAKTMDEGGPVDIFCAFTYPWNVWPCTEEAITQEFNPKAFVGGPGANFGLFADPGTSGLNITQIEGIISFTIAAYGQDPAIDAVYDKIAYQIEEEQEIPHGLGIGLSFIDYWGHPIYWASLQIWQHAIEEVGYVSQDKLKDELRSYNSYDNGVDTILGRTWYTIFGDGGGCIDYKCHTGEIAQWIDGKFETIGYEGIGTGSDPYGLDRYETTGTLVYPKPAFPSP